MKFLLLIGGLVGFGIGLFFSWIEESSWPALLWHASLSAYLGGLLLRWWGGALQKNLAEAIEERQAQPVPVTARVSAPAKVNKP